MLSSLISRTLLASPVFGVISPWKTLSVKSQIKMSSVSQSCVVEVGGVSYWLRDRVERSLPATTSIDLPLTTAIVINLPNSAVSLDILESSFRRFADEDDVFSIKFIDGALIYVQTEDYQVPTATPTLSSAVETYLEKRSARLLFSTSSANASILPEGPYFVTKNQLHQAWRLYEDELEAFVSSSVPDAREKYGFQPLRANAYSGLHSVVAVPSRLSYRTTPEKPLNGRRISVKDLFHLEGMVTTIGSRSYAECYGRQKSTARYLQHLIDKGAVIVGKTKMGGYAGSEIPPEKCIDYLPPWNPRGDGYQGPSGSSSGAGASIAGYEWLDFALGTDTTGSMRMPASAHGTWGIRMSSDAVSMEGVVPSVSVFDTIGLMSRDITSLSHLTKVSMPASQIYAMPKKILYNTDWFPTANDDQQKMTDQFVQTLEAILGVIRSKVSFSDEWARSAPDNLSKKPLKDYLSKSGYWPDKYIGYHSLNGFRELYRKKFQKEPYASPWQRDRWELGQKTTLEERDQGLAEIEVFKKWVDQYILPLSADGQPEAIVVVPLGRASANYRDIVPPPDQGKVSPTSYNPLWFASILGFPQLVIPIGQNPYQSKLSGRTEYAPIVGSIVGNRGSELTLLQVAQEALEKAQWPTKVLTGRYMFHVGNNSRNSVKDHETMPKQH